MGSFKNKVNIFITDTELGVFQMDMSKKQIKKQKTIIFESGIIENGYIRNAESLLKMLKEVFKKLDIKPKHINIVIHGQNVLLREATINKADLTKNDVKYYLETHVDEEINFAFEKPNISYHIKSQTDEKIIAVVAITDENLLHDYVDVFERLGAIETSFDLSALVLHRFYVAKTNNKHKNSIIVLLYEQMISIYVLEAGVPVFAVIEDYTGDFEQFYPFIDNYIDRIENYYKHNIRNGRTIVSEVVVFNFARNIEEKRLEDELSGEIGSLNKVVFNMGEQDIYLRDIPKMSQMAFAANLEIDDADEVLFDIKIKRSNKINKIANYLGILAFAIFVFTALIFIPFAMSKEEIELNIYDNLVLQNHLEELRNDVMYAQDYTQIQIDYNTAYSFLREQNTSHAQKILDLLSKVSESLEVMSITINSETNEIAMILSANSSAELLEYLVLIYEYYGVFENQDTSRWMLQKPSREFLSELVMEVTIIYA